jgi:uncharacterized protein (DUF2147 family)
MAAAASPDGVWQSKDGEGYVEIAACAAGAETRCGTIVWIKAPLDKSGKPQADDNNPDAKLRPRPVCGLQVFSGMAPDAGGGFSGGAIYDPEEGKTYAGALTLDGDRLKVTGSIELPVLGKISDSETWTRVTTPFERCAAQPGK